MMRTMINKIFDNIDLPDDDVRVLEIGTGNGNGTTLYIHDILKSRVDNFMIDTYEGIDEFYGKAAAFWALSDNVEVINKFFCDKGDIEELVIPNIIGEGDVLTEGHYRDQYEKMMLLDNFEDDVDFVPDVIFIDSWRFCHAAIINKCKKVCNENTIFVMEDDFQEYGEEKILKKYFDLHNLVRYPGNLDMQVWNFITFNLKP